MSTGELTPVPVTEPAQAPSQPAKLHDLSCVAHLHSTYSDGTASIEEILAAARSAGTDVVMLTDHDTLGARDDGWEGWHDGVMLLVGTEVSPRGGHYLAFGIDEAPSNADGEAAIPAAVEAAGGFGFAAHPFSEGSRMSKRIGKPHGWPREGLAGLTGIELWSLTTDAAESWRHPLQAIAYMRNPEAYLDGPPQRHLTAWDELCAARRVVAVGGLDTHQHGFRVRGRMITPMPNERYFRLLSTYALCDRPPTGELAADAESIYSALQAGHCYLGVDAIAPARGFRFWAENGEDVALMGDERPSGSWRLRASAPVEAELSLLRDGRIVATAAADAIEHDAHEPGVYRVEARRRHGGRLRPWIYSNPIYLR